jgi:hypothetical protein
VVGKFKKNRDRFPSSKELVTFSIFLLIAASLWLFSALGKEYKDDIHVEIEYYNLPKEKLLYNSLPQQIDLLATATGFLILKHKIYNKTTKLRINLGKALVKENNKYKISKLIFFDQIEKQLNDGIKVNKIYYFDYDIDFSNVEVKEVKVIPNIKINLADQFHLTSDIKITPAKLKIYGEKKIIDTIKYVFTEKLILDKLKSNINRNINIKRIKGINIDKQKVKLEINVEQITEKSLKIPISIINIPDSIEIQAYPEFITVSFTVGFSKFDIINSDYFSAQIDYNKIDMNNKYANIHLIRYPKEISNVRYVPKKAEYLINKKND